MELLFSQINSLVSICECKIQNKFTFLHAFTKHYTLESLHNAFMYLRIYKTVESEKWHHFANMKKHKTGIIYSYLIWKFSLIEKFMTLIKYILA